MCADPQKDAGERGSHVLHNVEDEGIRGPSVSCRWEVPMPPPDWEHGNIRMITPFHSRVCRMDLCV